jgi:hypothetical protein
MDQNLVGGIVVSDEEMTAQTSSAPDSMASGTTRSGALVLANCGRAGDLQLPNGRIVAHDIGDAAMMVVCQRSNAATD